MIKILELNKIYNMDCMEGMKLIADNSIDSIVTDPPYELGFMGKSWDSTGIAYNIELWRECLRVLKPGGHLLAFGGTRTYHRMVVLLRTQGLKLEIVFNGCTRWDFRNLMILARRLTRSSGRSGKSSGLTLITVLLAA